MALGLPIATSLAVAEVRAKYVEVTIQEPALSLVEHIERFGLVRLHGGYSLHQHRFGFSRRCRSLCAKAAGENIRTAADTAAIIDVRSMAFLLFCSIAMREMPVNSAKLIVPAHRHSAFRRANTIGVAEA